MKAEEAYKWLYVHFAPCGDETKQDEAISIALEAIAKQIPKKPKKIDSWRLCPNCYEKHGFSYDYLVGMKQRGHEDISYCLGCGQAICWEVDEPDIPMEYYESGGK